MGLLGYGGNEWFRGRRRKPRVWLPLHRGASSMSWAIICGRTETGFSIFRPERPFFAPLAPRVLVSAGLLLGLALVAAWAIRRRRELALPLAWVVVWLLPVLNLWALDPQWMVTDRYLFLPSLALPWLVALVAPRRTAIALLSLMAVAFGGTLDSASFFPGNNLSRSL